MTGFTPSINPAASPSDAGRQEGRVTVVGPLQRWPEDDRWAAAGNGSVPAADRTTLLAGLNHDLAGEYRAILMYTHYSARLTGPYRRELRALFQGEIGDEQAHAQFLADKIAALGGDPTTKPREVPYADHPRGMLEHALAAEKQAVADYTERIRQAKGFGDIGLRVVLESHVADETRHQEEIERILAGWNEPNMERARNEDRWQDDSGTIRRADRSGLGPVTPAGSVSLSRLPASSSP